MNIAIIGGRDFSDYKYLENSCEQFNFNQDDTIISGGAKGADSLAESYAKSKNIPTKIFLPDWYKFGKSAGFKRNILIINNADLVIAFWDFKSKGTNHSIKLAKKQNKKLFIFRY